MHILTVKELSGFLKVKEKTLYQWAEMGQIPSLKMNGVLRFDGNEIEQWVGACKREANSGYNPLTRLEARQKGGKNN